MYKYPNDKNPTYGDDKATEDSWYSEKEVKSRSERLENAMIQDYYNGPHWEYGRHK